MIYLDSASEDEARTAQELGYVHGVTTNPKLMAASGRQPLEQLAILLESVALGPVFYQPLAIDPDRASAELDKAVGMAPERVIIKLPAQRRMVRLAAELVEAGTRCAITGIYTKSQVLVAASVGADWVIPYVDRSRRLRPEVDLIPQLASVVQGPTPGIRILAASIKSPEQASRAIADGAHAVSAPLEVLLAMPDDPLTDSAVEEFAAAYS